jgi:hypothetical protein
MYFNIKNIRTNNLIKSPLHSSFISVIELYAYSNILNCILSLNMLYIISIIVLLSGIYTGPLNKFLTRDRRKKSFYEEYNAKHRRGSNDGRVVNLSFFNVGSEPGRYDPERPSKIVFDINDPNGNLLPIIYPENSNTVCQFLREGILYKGLSLSPFSHPNQELGTMERVNSDCYTITARKPDQSIMNELNRRGISVFSGNLPLTSVVHYRTYPFAPDAPPRAFTFVYIYANRSDAIGVFNPNDPGVLPQ